MAARLLLEFGDSHDLGMKKRTARKGRTALVMACDLGLVEDTTRIIGNAQMRAQPTRSLADGGAAMPRSLLRSLPAELGARVNEGDRKGSTPLMAAVRRGCGNMLDGPTPRKMREMMAAADDATVDGPEGADAVDEDVENDKVELVEVLLRHKADPNMVDEHGDTALHFVCEQEHSPVITSLVKLLLAAGADPGKVNSFKDTPLHLAVDCLEDSAAKSKAVVLSLLEANAPCQAKNRKRRTPYEQAKELNKPTLAAIIAKFDEFAAGLEKKAKKGKKGKN